MHRRGDLGGQIMPEDANPKLSFDSKENYLFFTLPMALNYQRNSYALWRAATATYLDYETRFVFSPHLVSGVSVDLLRTALQKHKLALQPNKHVATWGRICKTLEQNFSGDVRVLMECGQCQVDSLQGIVQKREKAGFPYLSGGKIFNYWLFVLERYTDLTLGKRHLLSIAPDTHVVQATLRLELLDRTGVRDADLSQTVAQVWEAMLTGTEFLPIDVHTPLWLWSRAGFPEINLEPVAEPNNDGSRSNPVESGIRRGGV